ncbi:MAG: monooxygenase [Acidobacteria bacterium]|nr:MAG: monooxygenase [Acidobacteriota bacterium]
MQERGSRVAQPSDGAKVYDLVGVGFGPANLALAVVLEEAQEEDRLERLFLEGKPSFVWHPSMLLEDSLLQITVIKDLITVVNPRSRFTFLNYLKENDRLYEFLNLRDLFPTRIEFNDYLRWAAGILAERVRYGRWVERIMPADADGRPLADAGASPALLRVEARTGGDGARESYLTRNLVVATGGTPATPPGISLEPGGRIFHSNDFLERIKAYPDRHAPYRFLVVGSGQSAAEIFEYLIDHYPAADVTATTRRFAYKPVDESDFTNRIFFPEWVDYYHSLAADKRRKFFDDLKDVNYAVIDHALIHRIYKKLYQMKVRRNERARLVPFLELIGIEDGPEGAAAEFRDVMREEAVRIEGLDGAVLCTGYEWHKKHPLLADLEGYLELDDRGGFKVERDYGIASKPGFKPRVYLQGFCEDTHGISETVLSLLPVRAEDIRRSVLKARSRQPALAMT